MIRSRHRRRGSPPAVPIRTRQSGVTVCALLLAAATLAGCSSLEVTTYDGTAESGRDDSIPVYLPKHDFVVTRLGLDDNGKPVLPEKYGFQVALVTRPDPDRGFLVTNSTGIFSASEFSINRDVRGRMTAVSGSVDDQTLETVQALASFIPVAAVPSATDLAAMSADARAKVPPLERELAGLNAFIDRQIEILATTNPNSEEFIEIEKALAAARKRRSAIKAALAGKSGSKPYGVEQATVRVCSPQTDDDAPIEDLMEDFKEQIVKQTASSSSTRHFFVFLVPTEPREGKGIGKC